MIRKQLKTLWIAVLLSLFISCGVRNSDKAITQTNDTYQSKVYQKDSTKKAVTLIDAGDSSESITFFLDTTKSACPKLADTTKAESKLENELLLNSYKVEIKRDYKYKHSKKTDSTGVKAKDSTGLKTNNKTVTVSKKSADSTTGTNLTHWFTVLSFKEKLCISAFVTGLLLLVYLGKKII